MDDWTKRMLAQHSEYTAVAAAYKEIQKYEELNKLLFPSGGDFARALAAGEKREALRLAGWGEASAMRRESEFFAANANWARITHYSSASEIFFAEKAKQLHRTIMSPSIIDEATRIAEIAQHCSMHTAFDPFRPSVGAFADRLLNLPSLDAIRLPANLEAFMQASAVSDIFSESSRVDWRLHDAARQFSLAAVPAFEDLTGYRQFLNASGLVLPHWPNVRLLTIGEKRRRFRAMVKSNSEPAHARKGRSLVQRYELTLRDILDEVMTSAYGEDWAETRLPLCDCKDLLGKQRKRGGHVLSHADYAHYEKIMGDRNHFETVFETGFDDRNDLAMLIKRAGNLRAALFHFHPFSPEDLRDLRLIWLTIETGLLALTADYDFDGWE